MKRFTAFILSVLLTFSATSCSTAQPLATVEMEPDVSQMKAICELAVMDCYYHNVAKFKEEDADGFLWWKKDKHFWIEYSGVVKLGIDVSQVSVEVNETEITVTIPEAKVLSCAVDSSSLSDDSFIVAKDSAEIEAADEVAAFDTAQRDLEETASNDTALLTSARQRAQSLLEDYITNIEAVSGKKYTIEWVYLEPDAQKPEEKIRHAEGSAVAPD